MQGVESRGNPNGPTLDGEELDLVHLRRSGAADGTRGDYPDCSNGAFNLRWTRNHALVTCPKCKTPTPRTHQDATRIAEITGA